MRSDIDSRVQALLAPVARLGRRGRPLRCAYALLLERDLLLAAYARIARNAGSLTPGVDGETAEGMSVAAIDTILRRMREDRYVWAPLRAVPVPKAGGTGTRTLLIPSWSDRIVHEAMRLILGAYFEPQLSPRSYGFRPSQNATAAVETALTAWPAPDWFIKTDIASCFESLDHCTLLERLGDGVEDQRFLALLAASLRAGQIDGRRWGRVEVGVPQGSPLSPLLANIYLDPLDRFVERELLPAYRSRLLRPSLRRGLIRPAGQLEYARYVDDLLLAFSGSRRDAECVLDRLRAFLYEPLHLQLAEHKTHVVDACHGVRFLGYDLAVAEETQPDAGPARLRATLPGEVLDEWCARFAAGGRPLVRHDMAARTPRDLIALFSSELGSFVAYYRLASNAADASQLHRAMEASLVATLVARFDLRPKLLYQEFARKGSAGQRSRSLLPVPSISRHSSGAPEARPATRRVRRARRYPLQIPGIKLAERLAARTCEACGEVDDLEAHHRGSRGFSIAPARYPFPGTVRPRTRAVMLCPSCHQQLHDTGRLPARRPASGQNDPRAHPSSPGTLGQLGRFVARRSRALWRGRSR